MNAPKLKLATIKEGLPYPKGRDWDGEGVNFALFSAHATRGGAVPVRRVRPGRDRAHRAARIPRRDLARLRARPASRHHLRLPRPRALQARRGHRFNPNKLLLDPYARAHIGELKWDPAVFGYKMGEEDTTFDERDSAPFMPKSVVVDPDFKWHRERVWRVVPWDRTIVYETHVRGFTKLHPAVPRARARHLLRPRVRRRHRLHEVARRDDGRAAADPHLHQRRSFLLEKQLTNYWGYNSIGFFAPDPRYAADPRSPCRNSRRWWRASTTRASR